MLVDELEILSLVESADDLSVLVRLPAYMTALSRMEPADDGTSARADSCELVLELTRLASGGSRLTAGLSEAMDWYGAPGAELERLRIHAGRLMALDADASSGLVSGEVSLPETEVTMALEAFVQDWFDSEATVQPGAGSVVAALAGLGATLGYSSETGVLAMTGLNLGPRSSTVALEGGSELLRIDVNAAANRAFDVSWSAPDGHALNADFPQGFDLHLGYSMSNAQDLASGLPGFTIDDTLAIQVGATSQVTFLDDPPGTDGALGESDLTATGSQAGNLLRLGAGSLNMTSLYAPEDDVAVAPGQCLFRHEANQGSHEFLGYLQSQICN
jgi:hypothetical protein